LCWTSAFSATLGPGVARTGWEIPSLGIDYFEFNDRLHGFVQIAQFALVQLELVKLLKSAETSSISDISHTVDNVHRNCGDLCSLKQ